MKQYTYADFYMFRKKSGRLYFILLCNIVKRSQDIVFCFVS